MSKGNLAVIKYGGHAMDVPELHKAFAHDLAGLIAEGMEFVIVHGGGPQINSLLEALHIQSVFKNGLRVTDDATLDVVEMSLCGKVNKSVVRQLLQSGIPAAGISGEDGGLLEARQKSSELGRVGDVTRVNPKLLRDLLQAGFTPVVAPLALDENGNVLNINADTAAGSIAGTMEADHFVLISDVPGVIDNEGNLFPSLAASSIRALEGNGIIFGGMIPKAAACVHALKCGCKDAIILDGRQPNSLRRFLADGEPLGTTIKL